ncbi:MAG: hypothetical protein U0Q16_35955 [Bryobacteraceae bacterium]
MAIDYTHAFTCGKDLTRRSNSIDDVRDPIVFGCFDEFRPFLTPENIHQATTQLVAMNVASASRIVASVPEEWEVDAAVRAAWANLITDRARFVATSIRERLRLAGSGNG